MATKIHLEGIYAYTTKEGCVLYIGRDADICCETRHKAHLIGDKQMIDRYINESDDWEYVLIMETHDKALVKISELILISHYQPEFNLIKGAKELQKWHAKQIIKLEKYAKKKKKKKNKKNQTHAS